MHRLLTIGSDFAIINVDSFLKDDRKNGKNDKHHRRFYRSFGRRLQRRANRNRRDKFAEQPGNCIPSIT